MTNEPDGSQVPKDSMNGEEQLYTFFQSRNDPVDWLADAHTTPATFSPLCNFSATFVLHQAGGNSGVGWYNVDPNATTAPAAADIHIVVPAGAAVGTVVTSSTIKGDPAYAGGLVGFALVTSSQIHYSEQKWNVACVLCSTPGPWILSVTYASKTTPDAYYLAFEDGNVSAFSFGNDGDFNDDVFFFQGLTCDGGGTPCSTGQPGLCAAGLNVCSATGLTCQPIATPSEEKCNGVDDDCNGQTDEGDLCDPGFVCDRGKCVQQCNSSEFSCAGDTVCNSDGFCVDPPCQNVLCAAGSVCVGGTCKAPCDGIACPLPSVCRVGACVYPCEGVECQVGSVCSDGVCVPGCGCNPCAAGTACDPTTELCIDPACVGVTCSGIEQCVAGTCVDPCTNAVCPEGQVCTNGACIPSPDAGAGGSGASSIGGALSGFGASFGTSGSGGTVRDADAGTGVGSGARGGGAGTSGAPLGCGCRTSKRSDPGSAAVFLGALLALGQVRRRRGSRK